MKKFLVVLVFLLALITLGVSISGMVSLQSSTQKNVRAFHFFELHHVDVPQQGVEEMQRYAHARGAFLMGLNGQASDLKYVFFILGIVSTFILLFSFLIWRDFSRQ